MPGWHTTVTQRVSMVNGIGSAATSKGRPPGLAGLVDAGLGKPGSKTEMPACANRRELGTGRGGRPKGERNGDVADFTEASKKSWTSSDTVEHINAGSLQRIAAATEKMAESYDKMRNDRDYYKRRFDDEHADSKRLWRRCAALRGVITRMKRQREAGR